MSQLITAGSIKNEMCRLQKSYRLGRDIFGVTFLAPEIAIRANPGQFVMINYPALYGFMLPRPFSVGKADPVSGEITLIVKVIGRGTEILVHSDPGSKWGILGPLGKGFPDLYPDSLLVAGGMGVVPILFLAGSSRKPCRMIFGARTASELFSLPHELTRSGLTIIETTEDGTRGIKGTTVDIMKQLIPEVGSIYACGPRDMLAAVDKIALQAGVKGWLALEELMACGVGACLGCVVATGEGYKRVCQDGPVFEVGEVVFDDCSRS
ncbi:MAG: dihydroorotate dehydrogenase electron transfer subunit [Bacillota bacterium]|nr:dihydroorotate dehydrogenase electron transfer subunit [Bacillota bacterium]